MFNAYGHGADLGHVTKIILTDLCLLFQRKFFIKFRFDWPSGFREDV